jgi:transcriptional regulator with XRE-family HTH domain
MDLGEQLRARALELGLSDAEVARRVGLGARRYGHYVTGQREPDLRTLLLICKVLDTSPNQLLGLESAKKKKSGRDKLVERLMAAVSTLDDDQLHLAIAQVEAIVDYSLPRR